MGEPALLWGSLGLAALAGIVAWILDGAGRGRGAGTAPDGSPSASFTAVTPALILIVLVSAAAALGDAATRNWGIGFAAGGVAAMLAWLIASRSQHEDATTSIIALSLGVIVPTALWLWRHDASVDGLAGVAAAWCVAALFLSAHDDSARAAVASRILAAATVFAVAVAAATILGALRDAQRPDNARWTAAVLAIAALVPFAAILRSLLARLLDDRRGGIVANVVAAIGLLAAVVILARTLQYDRLPLIAAAGIGAGAVSWAVVAEMGGSPLSLFVVLAGALAGFYLEAGLGVVLAVVVGCAVMPAARFRVSVTRALAFGVIFGLYRVAFSRFEDLMSGPTMTDPFLLFTLLGGALTPAAIAAFLESRGNPQMSTSFARRFVGLVAIVAVVALVVLLWGARAAIGITIGAAVSLASVAGVGAEPRGRGAPTVARGVQPMLVAILIASLAANWTGRLVAMAPETRADKILVVGLAAAVTIVAIAAAEWTGRRARGGTPATEVNA